MTSVLVLVCPLVSFSPPGGHDLAACCIHLASGSGCFVSSPVSSSLAIRNIFRGVWSLNVRFFLFVLSFLFFLFFFCLPFFLFQIYPGCWRVYAVLVVSTTTTDGMTLHRLLPLQHYDVVSVEVL